MKATEVIKKTTDRIKTYVGGFITSLEPEAPLVPVEDWYRMNLAGRAQGESWFHLTRFRGMTGR